MYCGRYKGDVAPLRHVAKCQADKIGQRATRHYDNTSTKGVVKERWPHQSH
jgi:hypothetical protein